ncbi:serine/threonine-protein kinase Sgk2 [Poronia punctata]|nr:serine/threonine-protein kinase Sgk2 [Poronia punctata]
MHVGIQRQADSFKKHFGNFQYFYQDTFLEIRTAGRVISPTSSVQIRWDHVQVIGLFYHRGGVCYRDGLLRLCRSAYQVFASQPTRVYLHGFYMRGSLIELNYQRVADQDLGKNNIIETDKGGSYVILDNVVTPSLGKLYLESQSIASREKLVGTGTTCYRARTPDSDRWHYILKFKWRWARKRPEDELLKLAEEKCVWGAVSLHYCKEVESTANLRRSLRWGTHRDFDKMHSRKENAKTNNYFQNRILAYIVTSPIGRPLHTFQSLLELLKVFRDAIKCHRSLYYDAKILHQDISPGNMIILDGQNEAKPQGILINLDSAIQLAEELGTEPGITGTRPFMAISVLKSECHTYRHDLESFLHTVEMGRDGFQTILDEFTPEFYCLKPLAEWLRQILFPERIGSPEAVDKLYHEMIRAFEEAIASEGRKDMR